MVAFVTKLIQMKIEILVKRLIKSLKKIRRNFINLAFLKKNWSHI